MRDEDKSHAELLVELRALREQVAAHQQAEHGLAQSERGTQPALSAADAARFAGDEDTTHGVHPTILLIEDEAIVRRTTRAVLATGGYDVVEAADGEEGLAIYDREGSRIDLVLLDWSMPRLSGELVLAELVKRAPNVRVVLFSGQRPSAKLQPNVRAIIDKPSPVDSVLSIIRLALDA